jgi:hypothetical protein
MDHNVNRAVVQGLRLRGVDLLTAYEDHAHELADEALLDRATALRRVLFSTDVDLVVEARKRQVSGTPFAGVVFARQERVPIGIQIDDLELIAKTAEAEELEDSLLYLPLRPAT